MSVLVPEVKIDNMMEQLAVVEPEFLDAIGIEKHFVRIGLSLPSDWKLEIWEEGNNHYYYDEWGIKWGMPKDSNLYFDMVEHPLANCTSISQLKKYIWPKVNDEARFYGIEYLAKAFRKTPYAIIGYGSIGAGILEQSCWMSGTEKEDRWLYGITKCWPTAG